MLSKMLSKMFRKRFEIGDAVRLIRSGQKAVIIDKGSLLLARKHTTAFVLKFENGSRSVTVMPEDRSNSGSSFPYAAEKPPEMMTLTCANDAVGHVIIASPTTVLTAARRSGFIMIAPLRATAEPSGHSMRTALSRHWSDQLSACIC